MKGTSLRNFSKLPAQAAETCWLAAALVVPLSINLQAAEVYHAPKAAITQSLGLVSLLAILWHVILSRGQGTVASSGEQSSSWRPLLPAVALILVSSLSSVFSVDPPRSLLTSPLPSFAPLSLIAFFALMASMAVFLRSKQQIERLMIAIVCASIPVALIAVLQRYGLQFPGTEGRLVSSLAGGAIFLAGYLLMVIPLTTRQLYLNWPRQGQKIPIAALAYGAVMFLQLAALLACEKRGAFLSLTAAFCVSLVLWGTATGRRTLLKRAAYVAAAVGCILLFLAILRHTGVHLHHSNFLDRLSAIIPLGDHSSDPFRAGIWNAAASLWLSVAPLVTPAGSPDPWHSLRFWIGYGPDTVGAVIPTKWIWIFTWPVQAVEESCHSMVWDYALSLGLVGVFALFWLFFELFLAAFALMGLEMPRIRLLASLSILGAAAGAAIFGFSLGIGFVALGLQVGFLGALLASVCRATLRSGRRTEINGRTLLGLALAAALTAHWVDIAFLFQTVNTAAVFWLYAGILCAANRAENASSGTQAPPSATGAPRPAWAALAGVAIGFALLHGAADIPRVLSGMAPLDQLWGPLPFAFSILVAGAISISLAMRLTWACDKTSDPAKFKQGKLVVGLILLYAAVMLWFVKFFASAPPRDWPILADLYAVHFPVMILLGIGLFAVRSARFDQALNFSPRLFVASLLALIGLLVIWQGPVRSYRSDVLRGFSMRLGDYGRTFLDLALALRPADYRARSIYTGLLTEWGPAAVHPTRHAREEAAQLLEEGKRISAYNLQSSVLGRLYLRMAADSRGEDRLRLAKKASEALRQAVLYVPQNEKAWFNSAIAAEWLTGTPEGGNFYRQKADALTALHPKPLPSVDPERWAEYYTNEALATKGTDLFPYYAGRALHYIERTTKERREYLGEPELSPAAQEEVNESIFWSLLREALVLDAGGRPAEAEAAINQASEIPLEKLPIAKEELPRLLKKDGA